MIASHRISPRNKNEVRMIEALELAATILEEALNVKIVLQAQRQVGWAGTNAYHAGMYVHEHTETVYDRKTQEWKKVFHPSMIKINFRNLEGATALQVLTVLGHEFRHAVQYQTEWKMNEELRSNYDMSAARSSYWNRDVEIDARAFQEQYAQIVLDDPRFAEYVEALNIDGERMMKVDYTASYSQLGVDREQVQLFAKSDKTTWYALLDDIKPFMGGKIKKWNKAACRMAWQNSHIMRPWVPVMVPVSLDELVS